MYIVYEDGKRLNATWLKNNLAKDSQERCYRAGPDGNHSCSMKYGHTDPDSGMEPLHRDVDENGVEHAEWYEADMMNPAAIHRE